LSVALLAYSASEAQEHYAHTVGTTPAHPWVEARPPRTEADWLLVAHYFEGQEVSYETARVVTGELFGEVKAALRARGLIKWQGRDLS
jgi:hypothetical protein